MKKEYFVLYTPENMNRAFDLLKSDISKEEILCSLNESDDIKKQVCLLKLNEISNNTDAEILTSVLTGQHGPIREICSAKINQFIKNEKTRKYFCGYQIRETILNALNDIIPTVARNIIEVINLFPEKDILAKELLKRINNLLNTDSEEIKAVTNHEIIKKTFKLYWYLEALTEFSTENYCNDYFQGIIEKTYRHEDYTIREKVAKILSKTTNFETIAEVLKKDSNPYVYSYLINKR